MIFLSNVGGCGEQHCLARGTHQQPGDSRHSGALTFGCSATAHEQGGQSQVLATRSNTCPREQAGAAGNGARGTWDVRLFCGSIPGDKLPVATGGVDSLVQVASAQLGVPCLWTNRRRA